MSVFRPYDLPDSPVATNHLEISHIRLVPQKLREDVIQSYSGLDNHIPGRNVSGKLNDQVLEETVANYLLRTAELGETIRERHTKKQAILAG